MTSKRIFAATFACALLIAALKEQPTWAQTAAGKQPPSAPSQASAQTPAFNLDIIQPVPYESMNEGNPAGDKLSVPRKIAAAIVAQDNPAPKFIVDFGSHQGEFLEAFMQRIPTAHGQWTEPVTKSEKIAHKRLARFGNRVTYVIGCPSRDISDGCVPKNADVIITSWISIHQPLDGIKRVYRLAEEQLPHGGWLVNLDHVTESDPAWQHRLEAARTEFHAKAEGPGPHLGTPAPTLDEQIAAFKAAGFDNELVVWRSFTTVLIMAKKP